MHHSCLQGTGGKACAHREPGAELQAFEVEAIMGDMLVHVPEELHLCHSTALRPHDATGNTDLCLLDAQEGALLHSKHQLSGKGSLEGIGQTELAEAGWGQHC